MYYNKGSRGYEIFYLYLARRPLEGFFSCTFPAVGSKGAVSILMVHQPAVYSDGDGMVMVPGSCVRLPGKNAIIPVLSCIHGNGY